MPKLEYLMTCHVNLKPGVIVGAGPVGLRRIIDVAGGNVEGPKIKASILESGADWLLMGSDGVSRLDVRGTFKTDDGAFVYMQYFGILEMTESAQQVLAEGKETEYGDIYFFTQPRFETGDERYAWLNKVVAVGEGRVIQNGVEYKIYHVLSD